MCSDMNPFSVSSRIDRSSAPTGGDKRREIHRDETTEKRESIMYGDLTSVQPAQWITLLNLDISMHFVDCVCGGEGQASCSPIQYHEW